MAETMNMVERVARAMAASNGTIWGGPRGEDDPDFMLVRLAYLSQARAAIEAMRGLPPAMSKRVAHDTDIWEMDVKIVWEEVIDAALSEGGE